MLLVISKRWLTNLDGADDPGGNSQDHAKLEEALVEEPAQITSIQPPANLSIIIDATLRQYRSNSQKSRSIILFFVSRKL